MGGSGLISIVDGGEQPYAVSALTNPGATTAAPSPAP